MRMHRIVSSRRSLWIAAAIFAMHVAPAASEIASPTIETSPSLESPNYEQGEPVGLTPFAFGAAHASTKPYDLEVFSYEAARLKIAIPTAGVEIFELVDTCVDGGFLKAARTANRRRVCEASIAQRDQAEMTELGDLSKSLSLIQSQDVGAE